MLFDGDGVMRELFRFGVGDRKSLSFLVGNRARDGGTARALRLGEPHANRLTAHRLPQDRRSPRGEVRLVEIELVRIDRALHDGLAQSVGRRDEDDLVEPGFGVQREHDPGRAQVAAHHPLNADRQRDMLVRKALMDAIGNRAVVVEARKYFLHCMKYIV